MRGREIVVVVVGCFFLGGGGDGGHWEREARGQMRTCAYQLSICVLTRESKG